ncbi:type I-E CRISPR-associated protein Cse2/CasB [Litorilinea aerophila]|nr:type I-E CRISPR-associated protein Cse2/CasB [Litorilinea aerophila]MCC9077953.1 type I-E CRISPR-associated protein Cse2/CasB [Litorilinea aerophila]
MSEGQVPFITYLESLRDQEDRGALAALRRGLGAPGTAHSMFPYVVPWLPEGASRQQEDAYFLVAALFAYHPAPGGTGNMGDHFARARTPDGDDTAIERRFTALLAAHREDLPVFLRQAVGFLRSKEVPVNWHTLFRDIRYWDHPSGYVQRNWARAFWQRRPEAAEQETQAE